MNPAMESIKAVLPMFLILLICTASGYSMCRYRVPEKIAYACFMVCMLFCLAVNSYVLLQYGKEVFYNLMLFTTALPFFALILVISKDQLSQTFFNFWLWINIYTVITNLSLFINEVVFRSMRFNIVLRLALFVLYFVAYNKFIKKFHRLVIEKLQVNWWIFSLIPMLFTLLVLSSNRTVDSSSGYSRNFPMLLIIYLLMALVYLLIGYTFRTIYIAGEKELLAQNMRDQITLQKRQYEYYVETVERERIFRHNQRFRNSILLNLLEAGMT